jgi:pimeloyl-ACP methyl ester carboxylesterase
VTPSLDRVRVIALDFRGHGLSDHAGSYGYADYVSDLTSLLDRLELEDVTVAGHSLGGYVALLAACSDDRIARVLAIDVKSDWTDEDVSFVERARGSTQRVEADLERLVGRIAQSVSPSDLDAKELELLAERAIERVEGGWRFRWDRRVLAPEPVDPFAFLGRVPCPARVIAGSESDVMPPDKAHRFADAIPCGSVEIVDGAGHHVELDAPELLAERILG